MASLLRCILVLLVGSAGSWLLAAAQAGMAPPPRPLYALLAAYPPEVAAYRKLLGIDQGGFDTTEIRGVRFDRGSIDGREVVVFQAGASLVNAAYQLQLGLDHFPITHILFAGVAGGTDPALDVGDVVIPERWAYHGESVYVNPDGAGGWVLPPYYKPKGRNFEWVFPDDVAAIRADGEGWREMQFFPADPELLAAARRALPGLPVMEKAGRPVRVTVGGAGVSASVFVDNAAYRDWLREVWGARCVDMESTAYAHVAWANQKPVLIVRGLSDLAGGQKGHNPIDDTEYPVSEIAVRVLLAILRELPPSADQP